MEFYTVKQIANMFSVNEETVRRWIRDNKLNAERGIGRQGSKVSTEDLNIFLNENKGLITSAAASALGIRTATVGTSLGGILSVIPFVSSIVFASCLEILKAKGKNKMVIKLELVEKEIELEQIAMQLKNDISSKEHELELVEIQITKLKEIIKERSMGE